MYTSKWQWKGDGIEHEELTKNFLMMLRLRRSGRLPNIS